MNWEFSVLDAIQQLATPWLDRLMIGISWLGNSGWIWIVAGVALLFTKKYRRSGILVLVALLLGLLIANLTIKPLVARLRPFQVDPTISLLIPPPGEFSFPSGHSVSSAAAATVLTLANKKFGWVAVPLALLIAFSRLYLYVHFPTDVIAGLLLGMAIGLLTWFVLRPVTARWRLKGDR